MTERTGEAMPGVRFRDLIRREIQKQMGGVDQVSLGSVAGLSASPLPGEPGFVDEFTGVTIDPSKWVFVDTMTQNNQLITTGAGTTEIQSRKLDMGSRWEFVIEWVQRLRRDPPPTGGQYSYTIIQCDWFRFQSYEQAGALSGNPNLTAEVTMPGPDIVLRTAAYNPVAHRWLKITFHEGVATWFTAAQKNGPWAWFAEWSGPMAPASEGASSMVYIEADSSAAAEVPGIFDNVSVTKLGLTDVDVLLDGMSMPVPATWAAGVPASVGDRVSCIGLREGQQWIVTGRVGYEGDHYFRHGGAHDVGGGDPIPFLSALATDWVFFTPVLTAETTNPVLGTGGSALGRYKVIPGNNLVSVIYRFYVRFGSSGVSAGSGRYLLSVPRVVSSLSPSEAGVASYGMGVLFDWSVPGRRELMVASRSSAGLLQFNIKDGAVAHNVPWAWAADDRFGGTVFYEGVV